MSVGYPGRSTQAEKNVAPDERPAGGAMVALGKISDALKQAIEDTGNPHPDVGMPERYSAAVSTEAEALKRNMSDLMRPATERAIRLWLAPIQAAVRNPADPDRLSAWVSVTLLALRGLESGAFSDVTLITALRNIKFFPSTSDVYDIVAPRSAELRRIWRILCRIAEPGRRIDDPT